MSNVFEIRRDNLRRLMEQWGGPTSLAKKLGHSNGSYVAQLAGPHPTRDLSEKVARGPAHAIITLSGSLPVQPALPGGLFFV